MTPTWRRRFLLQRFARAQSGASAVEFAFTFPVLLIMLFGMIELGQLLVTQRRVENAGSSIGDVIARLDTLTTVKKTDIFAAASDIMGASATTAPDLRISQIIILPNGSGRYEWSDAQGTSLPAYAHCVPVTAPQVLQMQASGAALAAGSHILTSEVRYVWSSPFSYVMKKPITVSAFSVLSPRVGSVLREGASTTACT